MFHDQSPVLTYNLRGYEAAVTPRTLHLNVADREPPVSFSASENIGQ